MRRRKALTILLVFCFLMPVAMAGANTQTPAHVPRSDGEVQNGELGGKPSGAPESVTFTDAELALVKASQTTPVTVGLIASSPPVCYWDAAQGEYAGVFTEMLRTISARTGLQFKLIDLDLKQNPPIAWLKQGYPDLVVGIVKTKQFMDDSTLILSEQLLNDFIVVVGRKGDDFTDNPQEKTIAVPTGFQVALEYVAERFPQHNVIQINTAEACLDAVRDGEADAMLYMRSSISYILQNPHYETLGIVSAFTKNVDTCMAGRAADGATLLSVINKGLAMVTDDERNNMMMNYTIANPYQLTFGDILYKYRVSAALIILLLLAVITVLAMFAAAKRKSTKELQEAYEQEKIALGLAEKASAAKGSFMSRMSHEIRTPLNAVIGYNSIARSEMAGATNEAELRLASTRVMDCLTKSDIASRHLLTIINDVLDMSAIESGRIKVAHERFDFKSMISSLSVLFFAQAKAREVKFETVLDTLIEEWFVGDAMRINQILTNLLSNAVKFTPAGGSVWLRIRQPSLDETTAHIQFEIADTGIGMEPDFLAHIFAPFEQADATISRRFGGTGLGLSITKSLLDLMGGTVKVESQPGAGTTFVVELALERTEQPAERNCDFANMHALAVDDDRNTCEYMKLLFDRFGVRCETASSGEEALRAIAAAKEGQDDFTLCLIDWHMPGLDGLQTVTQLKHIAGNLPAMILTAYDYSAIEHEARAAGVDRFLAKPLFPSTLFDLLMDLGGRSAPVKKEKHATFDFSGARVLLAEDNKMNMEVARRILASAGLLVDCAWDGKEAVSMFNDAPAGFYSAILMDVQMPGMDGHAATRAIRAGTHPDGKTIPILAMTADAFAENVAESLSAGMNDHIAKPINVNTLFRTLQKYIDD